MSSQIIVSIDEVTTDIQSGFASGQRTTDGIVQLRMNNVTTDGNLDWSSYIRVPASEQQIKKFELYRGDILFNSTNSPKLVGKTAFFDGFIEPVVFSNHFMRLRVDKTRVDPRYLTHWFTLQWQKRVFESLSTQWVNQAAVRKEDLLALKLYLPPLPEQCRIVDLLTRADRLRRLRRYARELGDSFLQSVFVEMFGDISHMEKFTFSEVVKIDRRIATEIDCQNLSYIGLEHIDKDKGQIIKDYQIFAQGMLATNFRFTSKHVLYGKLRPYLNKVLLPTFDGVCTTEILPLLPVEKKVKREYLWAYLMAKRFVEWASNNVAGANLPRLAPEKLAEYLFPLPSLDSQECFAKVVSRCNRLRAQQAEAERQAEMLFQSLLAQTFGGELDEASADRHPDSHPGEESGPPGTHLTPFHCFSE